MYKLSEEWMHRCVFAGESEKARRSDKDDKLDKPNKKKLRHLLRL
jgi:hypothetical protein